MHGGHNKGCLRLHVLTGNQQTNIGELNRSSVACLLYWCVPLCHCQFSANSRFSLNTQTERANLLGLSNSETISCLFEWLFANSRGQYYCFRESGKPLEISFFHVLLSLCVSLSIINPTKSVTFTEGGWRTIKTL